MRRSVLILALTACVLAGHSSSASAQTIIVSPGELIGAIGGKDHDDEKPPKQEDTEANCPSTLPLICAGELVVDGAAAGAGAVGGAVMGGLSSWVGQGAAWLVTQIGHQIDRSTRPAVDSAWFQDRYSGIRGLAIALSALFLLLAVLQAVFRQDLVGLLRTVLLALPLSMLLMFAALALVQSGLVLTDWMTATVLGTVDKDAGKAFGDLAKLLVPVAVPPSPVPSFVLFLSACVTALLTLMVWLELVMREAAIYVGVAFLPLTFAAMVWERTAHWSRRLAEWLAALILAKFTIGCAFAVAVAALANARGGTGGLSGILAGSAILLVAAATPWALLRLIPVGTDAVLRRDHVRGAVEATPGVGTANVLARDLMITRFRGAVAGAPNSRSGALPPATPPSTRGNGGPSIPSSTSLPGRTETPASRVGRDDE
jgi:hypothetical protein